VQRRQFHFAGPEKVKAHSPSFVRRVAYRFQLAPQLLVERRPVRGEFSADELSISAIQLYGELIKVAVYFKPINQKCTL